MSDRTTELRCGCGKGGGVHGRHHPDCPQYASLPAERNAGHGHVTPRPDGVKARCGGPAICTACARELARKNINKIIDRPSNHQLRVWLADYAEMLECLKEHDPVWKSIVISKARDVRAWLEQPPEANDYARKGYFYQCVIHGELFPEDSKCPACAVEKGHKTTRRPTRIAQLETALSQWLYDHGSNNELSQRSRILLGQPAVIATGGTKIPHTPEELAVLRRFAMEALAPEDREPEKHERSESTYER